MIKELYDARRESLENDLSRCTDVKAAADCLGGALEKLRIDVRAGADTPAARHEVDRLFASARQAAYLMMSVTEADVTVIKGVKSRKGRILDALPWVSAGSGIMLTLWMILIGQNAAAALALVTAAAGILQAWRRREDAPADVTATTKVNVYELMRMTDRLTQAMDDAMLQAEEDRRSLPSGMDLPATGDFLSPVQMLMEAVYTEDGSYALKAAGQIEEALSEQGIRTVSYSPENRDWFDMFPGTEDGLTIRPAMVKDGRLLARGQATERV